MSPLTLQFDGGSRGNPGPAGIGVVLLADDVPILTLGRFIGSCTNNVAEYTALITGLEEALKLGTRKLTVRGDSELIIKQMKGEYRVKHPDMKVLFEKARKLVAQFEDVTITHNLRHKNELADKLANLAMDRKKDVTDPGGTAASPAPDVEEPTPVEPKAGDRAACPRCGCSVEIVTPSRIRPHQLKPFVCQCGAKMG